MSEAWDGLPENPEQDSDNHVLRVDGELDVYSWVAARQWFEDQQGRWVAPADLVRDGDRYIGQVGNTAHAAAAARAEREACAALCDRAAAEWQVASDNALAFDLRERAAVRANQLRGAAETIRARPAPSGADALAAALRKARAEGMRRAAKMIRCGCAQADDVAAIAKEHGHNSAARWNACGEACCLAIECANILDTAEAEERGE